MLSVLPSEIMESVESVYADCSRCRLSPHGRVKLEPVPGDRNIVLTHDPANSPNNSTSERYSHAKNTRMTNSYDKNIQIPHVVEISPRTKALTSIRAYPDHPSAVAPKVAA